MLKDEFNKGLQAFLDVSPTPFHAVEAMSIMLESAGFKALSESEDWSLEPGGRYYVIRNGSSIIAFTGLKGDIEKTGIRLFGAHTDSPCLKVKPQPEFRRKGYLQLGVEVYGGALLNPWFDRDLSIAGRVTYLSREGKVESTLVDWQKPVAMIPSLAIHLDREANTKREVNPQQHLPAVIMLAEDGVEVSFKELLMEQIKEQDESLDLDKILDYELSFYDTQTSTITGMNNEFITSARIDNLLSCYVGLQALLSSDGELPTVLVCNDHEEIGSCTAEGADGPFLLSVMSRLVTDNTKLQRAISRSLMFSVDNAHAIHPNYIDRYEENHGPVINQGPVIKMNVNQRYATNSVTSAFYKQLSEKLGLPYQVFVVRTDMGCGSTLGPLTAAKTGVKTLDVGAPQWAMHSIRESCGVEDGYSLYKVSESFFNTEDLPE